MKITVAILTCNRAALLRGCLEALAAQERAADEVLLVDNGSTDNTPAVIEAFAGRLPLRVVAGPGNDPWNGAAAARNLAVREAAGDWMAFTDDDCVPANDWLARIEAAARRGADAVGGWVEDAGDLRFPWWWHPEMNWTLGLSVPGMRGPQAGSVYYPQTANLGARRQMLLDEMFQELPPDDSGRPPAFRATREDAEWWRRIRLRGYRTVVDGEMVVRHRTEQGRARWGTVLRRSWQDGAGLQRREPSAERLVWAHEAIVWLPLALVFAIWRGPRAPWREAAWRMLWATREAGQWAQACRARGRWRMAVWFAWLTLKRPIARGLGWMKRAARWGLVRWRRLRRPRVGPVARPRSVVVAVAGYVGDTVLLHPFLNALKSQCPQIAITLLTNRAGEMIYRHDPVVTGIVLLEGGHEGRAHDRAAIDYALDRSDASLVLVPYFYGVDPTPLFSRRGVRVVTFDGEVGFSRRLHYDLADRLLPKPVGVHEGLNLTRLFHEAGLHGGIPEEATPLAFEPDELLAARQELRAEQLGPENLVIVAPGSGRAEKCWPEERWAEVIRYLVDEYDVRVVLSGSVSETGLCNRIARLADRPVKVWCHADLRRLALWIGEARLLLCPDNGCKHLAAEMDATTLCLFGPTDERQWGAIRHPHKHGVVRGCAWNLSPEERIDLPLSHQMDCISVERVCRALDEMLAERAGV